MSLSQIKFHRCHLCKTKLKPELPRKLFIIEPFWWQLLLKSGINLLADFFASQKMFANCPVAGIVMAKD